MRLFISWSGDVSERIAKIISDWIPDVLQSIEPFYSNENIRKGDHWPLEIARILSKTNVGILCLTQDNLDSPWLLFEAGALAKNVDRSGLFSILFDELEPRDLETPLSLYNATTFTKNDFYLLIKSLNSRLPPQQRLGEVQLKRVFDK